MPEDFVKASGQHAAAVYLLANRNNPVSQPAAAWPHHLPLPALHLPLLHPLLTATTTGYECLLAQHLPLLGHFSLLSPLATSACSPAA